MRSYIKQIFRASVATWLSVPLWEEPRQLGQNGL